MSWRAELLRFSLRACKERSGRRNISAAKARHRLRLVKFRCAKGARGRTDNEL